MSYLQNWSITKFEAEKCFVNQWMSSLNWNHHLNWSNQLLTKLKHKSHKLKIQWIFYIFIPFPLFSVSPLSRKHVVRSSLSSFDWMEFIRKYFNGRATFLWYEKNGMFSSKFEHCILKSHIKNELHIWKPRKHCTSSRL